MDAVQKVSASSKKKFLKEIDSSGGIEGNIKDPEVVKLYLDYCNSLLKPRKLQNAIEKILQKDSKNTSLMEFFIEYGNSLPIEIVKKIGDKTSVEGELKSLIEAIILSNDISGRFSNFSPSDGQISRMCQFINNPDLVPEKVSKRIMEELFLRLQKMYREEAWGVIIQLFREEIGVNDKNFQCYKFFILSLKRKGMGAKVDENLSKIY